jgi:methylthioxylose transferase
MAQEVRRSAAVGTAIALVLVAAAVLVPPLTGWDVHERGDGIAGLPPLHGYPEVKVGPGTPLALLVGLLTVLHGPALAVRLGWRGLLATTFLTSLGWLLGLALVDGEDGLSRVLGHPYEYLDTARSITSVTGLLSSYVDHIPLDSADNWPTHVAGHPPGMVLFFALLVKLGLGGDLAAGVVVTVIAGTLPAAVLVTARALGREDLGRSAAPFLVVTPAAVFLAVSADAVIATTVAWGLASLAVATRGEGRAAWPWAVLAGVLLGGAVMMSYGMPLAGLLALAVLVAGRAWWPLPVAAAAAAAVVLAFAAGGFLWWEALPVLRERYWDGIASERPASYWLWGDLAALVISGGPLIGAALGAAWAARRDERTTALLVGAAAVAVVAADVSRMSKGEVERIWLPFLPWLILGAALLPRSWHRAALALQVLPALLVQHLLYTSW